MADLSQFRVLASHRDADGYTAVIVHEVVLADGRIVPSHLREHLDWRGTKFILAPDGQCQQGGYWMDWPEDDWGLSEAEYQALPECERAALEARQQATAYAPLRMNFAFHRSRPSGTGFTLEQLLQIADKMGQ